MNGSKPVFTKNQEFERRNEEDKKKNGIFGYQFSDSSVKKIVFPNESTSTSANRSIEISIEKSEWLLRRQLSFNMELFDKHKFVWKHRAIRIESVETKNLK